MLKAVAGLPAVASEASWEEPGVSWHCVAATMPAQSAMAQEAGPRTRTRATTALNWRGTR